MGLIHLKDVPHLAPEQRWECPKCDLKQVTHEARVHVRMHPCRGLGGLTSPMVTAGTQCKVVVQHRDDYVGDEIVQRDENGRPVTGIAHVRDDGQDFTVFVPSARASMRDLDIDPAKYRTAVRNTVIKRRGRR